MALTVESLRRIYPKFDYKRTGTPKDDCFTCLSDKNPFNLPPAKHNKHALKGKTVGDERCSGKITDCRGSSRGLFFRQQPSGSVNVTCTKFSEECKIPDPVICPGRTRTRCTQTRYRESSAQTRAVRPDPAGDKENYKNFEVYQVSKLLEGLYPPGEYEAKVVERARRRRKFEKALDLVVHDKEKHRTVLEAMEWEDWIAREEDIQGCQMLRMKIVIQLFEEREHNLKMKSAHHIAVSSERIQAKRASQLKKINIDYARSRRRLEAKKQKINRSYHKGNITQDHVDPSSDLHAPQMRFGVNPNRRHYVGFRKNFDDRINDLDKRKEEKDLDSLVCPFSKLRSWAKPKEQMKEVTQRFLTDENLKNLYENLKNLRTIAETPKPYPTCLRKKNKTVPLISSQRVTKYTIESEIDRRQGETLEERDMNDAQLQPTPTQSELSDLLTKRRKRELSAKINEEIETVVGEFENTSLGKLIVFLNNELERLKLQKKFQAIRMLAEKERWKVEAYEAGIRQRENKVRANHEKLMAKTRDVHLDTATLYLQSFLEEEFAFTAEALANDNILELAQEIDRDNLESLRYNGREKRQYDRDTIRNYVRTQVFDVVEKRLKIKKTEKLRQNQIHGMEEQLDANVKKAIQMKFPTPNCITIVGELLDELITDAVTYDFDIITPSLSDDEFETELEIDAIIDKLIRISVYEEPGEDEEPYEDEDFVDSTALQTHLTARKESYAVVRKLIRLAVPDERWKTEGDRIVEQTLSDTFNDAVYEVECLKHSREVRNNDRLQKVISDIYRRMGGRKRVSSKAPPRTPSTSSTVDLPSIVSTIDIFDTFHNNSDGNSSDSSEDEEFHSLTGRFIYIDPSYIKKYEPPEIGHRHERFDIGSQLELAKPEESDTSVSMSISQASCQEAAACSTHHVEMQTETMNLSYWEINLHPELGIRPRRNSISIRSGKRYHWASFCYERTSDVKRSSDHKNRPSSI